jgi:hypothetical protein
MIVYLVDGTYELFRHRVKGFASRGPDSWPQIIFRLRDFLAHAKLSHRKK